MDASRPKPRVIPDLDALAAQCEFQAYRSSGPGGQNVNRRETAVRLTHRHTGLVVTCQEERSQWRNRQIALERLLQMLIERSRRRRPRKPTTLPRAARERMLGLKRQQAEKKERRRRPAPEA
jgi:protein subunit release factor B